VPVIGANAIALSYEISAQQLEHEYPQQDLDFSGHWRLRVGFQSGCGDRGGQSAESEPAPLQDDILQAKLLAALRDEFEEIIRPGGSISIRPVPECCVTCRHGCRRRQAIVRFRRQNGRYKCRTDLTKVPGMTRNFFCRSPLCARVRRQQSAGPHRIHPSTMRRYARWRTSADRFYPHPQTPGSAARDRSAKICTSRLSAQTLRAFWRRCKIPTQQSPTARSISSATTQRLPTPRTRCRQHPAGPRYQSHRLRRLC